MVTTSVFENKKFAMLNRQPLCLILHNDNLIFYSKKVNIFNSDLLNHALILISLNTHPSPPGP